MPDQKDLFDLTGKVAIVTGSTKGIGRAMAEGLAQAGATIVVSSRKQDLCSEVADQIGMAADRIEGCRHCVPRRRLGTHPALRRCGDEAARTDRYFGKQRRYKPGATTIEDMPLDLWRKVFNVNLEGPLRTNQLVAPILRDQGGGSTHQHCKYGWVLGRRTDLALLRIEGRLINLTKSMAQAWAPWNVRVIPWLPGPL